MAQAAAPCNFPAFVAARSKFAAKSRAADGRRLSIVIVIIRRRTHSTAAGKSSD